jgi:hypothetical protein
MYIHVYVCVCPHAAIHVGMRVEMREAAGHMLYVCRRMRMRTYVGMRVEMRQAAGRMLLPTYAYADDVCVCGRM